MKSTVEPREGHTVKLTVTIPAERVDRAVADAYTNMAKQVRVPGFRKGKAPRPVVDTYVGRERVLADAQEEIIEESYPQAIDANDLRPIDQPDFGELPGIVEHEDYTYEAEVELRPELTLEGDWKKIKVTTAPATASDEEVEAQVNLMRERFASLEPIEDRGVAPDDYALISFTGLVDGEAYEGNNVDKYLYELGRGQMPQEFDEAMMGAKPGETVQAVFTIPDTSSNPEFVGKTATFDITIHEIKHKHLPAADDEFAANAGGFDTIAEVRDDIRKRIEENKEFAQHREIERLAREQLAEHLTGDVPESMVMHRRDNMLREFFNNLEQRGISMRDYVTATGVDPEQIQKDIEVEAAARVKQELALEALFRAEGMEVTDADIDAELADIAKSSDKGPEELRAEWEQAGVLPVITETVMHTKAAKWLTDHADIELKEPEAEKPAEAAGETAAEKPKKARKSAKQKEE